MYGISRILLTSTSFPKTKVSAVETCRLPTVDAVVDLDPQGQESPSSSPTSTSRDLGYSETHRAPKTELLNCQRFFLKPSIAPLAIPLLPDVTEEKKSDVTEVISESEKWLEEMFPYLLTSRRKRRIRRRQDQTTRTCVTISCFDIFNIMVFGLCQFVIAVTYMHDCPARPLIPLSLMVWSLLTSAVTVLFYIHKWITDNMKYSRCLGYLMNGILALLGVVHLFAIIAVSFFTYSLHDFSTAVMSPNYCNPLLFWVTFGYVTVALVDLILQILCGIIYICYLLCTINYRVIVSMYRWYRRQLHRRPRNA